MCSNGQILPLKGGKDAWKAIHDILLNCHKRERNIIKSVLFP